MLFKFNSAAKWQNNFLFAFSVESLLVDATVKGEIKRKKIVKNYIWRQLWSVGKKAY